MGQHHLDTVNDHSKRDKCIIYPQIKIPYQISYPSHGCNAKIVEFVYSYLNNNNTCYSHHILKVCRTERTTESTAAPHESLAALDLKHFPSALPNLTKFGVERGGPLLDGRIKAHGEAFKWIWMFLWCKICLGSRWGVIGFCQAIALDMTLLLDFKKKSTRIGCKVNFAHHKTCIILGIFRRFAMFCPCLPHYPEASAEETCCFNDALKSLCLARAAAIRLQGTEFNKQTTNCLLIPQLILTEIRRNSWGQ